MVRSKIVLEVESDEVEEAADLVQQLRDHKPYALELHRYKVGSVAHVIEPDTERKAA